MINCNKYAYGGAAGPIEVALIENASLLRLIVADKGRGAASAAINGFGSRIINGLVIQLGGDLSYSDNKPGLRAEVIMSVVQSRK